MNQEERGKKQAEEIFLSLLLSFKANGVALGTLFYALYGIQLSVFKETS